MNNKLNEEELLFIEDLIEDQILSYDDFVKEEREHISFLKRILVKLRNQRKELV